MRKDFVSVSCETHTCSWTFDGEAVPIFGLITVLPLPYLSLNEGPIERAAFFADLTGMTKTNFYTVIWTLFPHEGGFETFSWELIFLNSLLVSDLSLYFLSAEHQEYRGSCSASYCGLPDSQERYFVLIPQSNRGNQTQMDSRLI